SMHMANGWLVRRSVPRSSDHEPRKIGLNALSQVANRLGATPMSVALVWLIQRSPNILLIPGTSSTAHLRENIAGAGLSLSDEDEAELDSISH
ncbi:aldo/keto reductase, partial [Streptomyces sp. NPDC008125]|uniref:aldo/keto reductase n=1 Tax=Streptomyces sp. NPDC008125 TaxID=3364811 RepID=UPI0036E8A877